MEILIPDNHLLWKIDDTHPQIVSMALFPEDNPTYQLWHAELRGLWKDTWEKPTVELIKIWDLHQTGDYYQHNIQRYDTSLHPHQSYTSGFHELLRKYRHQTAFIRNLYSTSKLPWLSKGYSFMPPARNFWKRQQDKQLAAYIEKELRYKALLGA